MSSNRPPIPVRAGRLELPSHEDHKTIFCKKGNAVGKICGVPLIISVREEGSFAALELLTSEPEVVVGATVEEVIEACERARAGDTAAKIIADLREEVARLCETIDDLREQIAEELNQEPPTRQRSTPP
jgi:hypothetical protein